MCIFLLKEGFSIWSYSGFYVFSVGAIKHILKFVFDDTHVLHFTLNLKTGQKEKINFENYWKNNKRRGEKFY